MIGQLITMGGKIIIIIIILIALAVAFVTLGTMTMIALGLILFGAFILVKFSAIRAIGGVLLIAGIILALMTYLNII